MIFSSNILKEIKTKEERADAEKVRWTPMYEALQYKLISVESMDIALNMNRKKRIENGDIRIDRYEPVVTETSTKERKQARRDARRHNEEDYEELLRYRDTKLAYADLDDDDPIVIAANDWWVYTQTGAVKGVVAEYFKAAERIAKGRAEAKAFIEREVQESEEQPAVKDPAPVAAGEFDY